MSFGALQSPFSWQPQELVLQVDQNTILRQFPLLVLRYQNLSVGIYLRNKRLLVDVDYNSSGLYAQK